MSERSSWPRERDLFAKNNLNGKNGIKLVASNSLSQYKGGSFLCIVRSSLFMCASTPMYSHKYYIYSTFILYSVTHVKEGEVLFARDAEKSPAQGLEVTEREEMLLSV